MTSVETEENMRDLISAIEQHKIDISENKKNLKDLQDSLKRKEDELLNVLRIVLYKK